MIHRMLYLVCLSALVTFLTTHHADAEPHSESWAELLLLQQEVMRLKHRIRILETENILLKGRLAEKGEADISRRTLSGVVTAVRKAFAEISLGSDDGLQVGDVLYVFHDTMYSGRVVVRRIDPDRAVVELADKDDVVRAGDQVSTMKPSATSDSK